MDGQMTDTIQNRATDEVSREPEPERPLFPTGAALLREAADMALADKSMDIALALAKSSSEGHIQSAKFLYELALLQENRGRSEQARNIRSIAGEWMDEPEWNGEMSEAVAQIIRGGVEPES